MKLLVQSKYLAFISVIKIYSFSILEYISIKIILFIDTIYLQFIGYKELHSMIAYNIFYNISVNTTISDTLHAKMS